ncbi:MAG: TIGR02680 family protein [Bifidobacteriaceae bacterium]|jgi:uncharacterized protein (TIGR02680 family)|nr:TIGR02680 family protein [Bifidobacteriaceae bacterium]
MMTDSLPQPTRERWAPLRLGLTELYFYDDEQFWFRDGRLLLRGNNGTGKSKVLALTLPFLLDGRLAPARVEPDADRGKLMEWNLLLKGAEDYLDRTGYTWLEFGRLDAATGVPEFFTIGCGLKAVRGQGMAGHWFFTTPRRVGELSLVDSSGVALTRQRLRDEVTADGRGRVFENDLASYRAALDEKLFKLGRERYDTLIDLLIQLRQPQLSVKPNEAKLADALTNSLAPIPAAVLADLAESFRALDEDKHRLEEMEAIQRELRRFMREHMRYAQAQSRSRAEEVRRTHSAYEDRGRELAAAKTAADAAGQQIAALDEARRTALLDLTQLEARREALRDSAVWGEARDLENTEREADAAGRRLDQARDARDNAVKAAAEALTAAEKAEGRALEADQEAAAARAGSWGAAQAAGLADSHEADLANPTEAARSLARRREQADHVGQAVEAAASAQQWAQERRRAAATAEAEASRRRTERERADQAAAAAGEALLAASRVYLEGLVALTPPDPDAVLDRVERWTADPEGWEFPLVAEVTGLAEAAVARVAGERQRLETEQQTRRGELADCSARLAELEAGAAPGPERRSTRRAPEAARPLFELVDFAPGVSAGDRAGLEAALEAAGLMDALVRPDGSVTDPATGDVLLAARRVGWPDPAGPTLESVLTPDPAAGDGAPEAGVVLEVLRGIGLGEGSGPVWVAADGAFGLGSAVGAWAKTEAQFVGAAARERQRLAALSATRAAIRALEDGIGQLEAQLAEADRARKLIAAERDGAPAREPVAVVRAVREALTAAREERAAASTAGEATRVADRAREAADLKQAEAEEAGRLFGVEPTGAGVGALRQALGVLGEALEKARGRIAMAGELRDAATGAARHADARAAEAAQLCASAATAEVEKVEAAERLATLRASVGAAVEELKAELDRVEASRRETKARADGIAQRLQRAGEERAAAKARREQLELRREEDSARRGEAFDRLKRFTALSLLRIALPDVAAGDLGSAASVVSLARQIEARLGEVLIDEVAMTAVRESNSRAVNDLRTELAVFGHSLESAEHSVGEEIRIRYGDRDLAADELADHMAEAIETKKRTLSAREREIIENYLMADTADQLAELIVGAGAWVKALNRELASRATSTGMKIRLRWEPRPEAPSGFDQVRGLLSRSGRSWSDVERGSIAEFLQLAIDEQRVADPASGWDEHLRNAFDYRRWHTFRVERSQGTNWVSGAGPASTGERALTLTLPLFAAAASYYSTAGAAHAPRLILLDEAFAGIDNAARAGAMGLFAEFDLDAVMTSEREWGCYPTVPGLAIAHLTRQAGVNAVHVSRWEWDGSERVAGAAPPAAAAAWRRQESP